MTSELDALLAGLPPERRAELLALALSDKGFRATYRLDPVGFVRDCVDGADPAPYQVEGMTKLVEVGRACIRSPHGVGKTATAAWLVLWFALTRDGATDWKAVTTASAWRQLTRYLWPEIHKWARAVRWDRVGREAPNGRTELLALSLLLKTGQGFAVASDDPALIEGAHADALLYVFDEAKAIPSGTFDAAEGAFSGSGGDTGREAYALAISTPGPPVGRFYDIQARRPGFEDWWTKHVTLEEAIAAGRISSEWAEQRARQWGEESSLYLNRVRGEFAADDESAVIPLSWVEAAVRRWLDVTDPDYPYRAEGLPALSALGVDPADGGGDASILAPRHGRILMPLEEHVPKGPGETMELAGLALAKARPTSAVIVVDAIGVGAGVLSRLWEEGATAIRFMASGAARDSNGRAMTDETGELAFSNLRAASWWRMRRLLSPENPNPIALPDDDLLVGELTAPAWRVDGAGRIVVEEKATVRKRIGRSTDRADAAIMAFWLEDLPTEIYTPPPDLDRGNRPGLTIAEMEW